MKLKDILQSRKKPYQRIILELWCTRSYCDLFFLIFGEIWPLLVFSKHSFNYTIYGNAIKYQTFYIRIFGKNKSTIWLGSNDSKMQSTDCLPEDPSLTPSTHLTSINCLCNSSSEALNTPTQTYKQEKH